MSLFGTISILSRVDYLYNAHIIGPVEDKEYWELCTQATWDLPSHVGVNVGRMTDRGSVPELLAKDHLFHTSRMTLSCDSKSIAGWHPVLISTETPWRELSNANGRHDIELANEIEFSRIIEQFATMDADSDSVWSRGAWDYGSKAAGDTSVLAKNFMLFDPLH